MSGWHVTANDIKNWTETNKRDAEALLPLIIKKLILASSKPKMIDFPSGDNVSVGGWDGMLEVDEGNIFIPSGTSGWELGTNLSVKKKADEDFQKRSKNPVPFNLNDTTFVFVTTRLWTKRDNWVIQKKAIGGWKDVKGINAEMLAHWLETCPAVHRWFSSILGKRCSSVWDIEEAWQNYSSQTSHKLTSDFLLHERDSELEAFLCNLDGKCGRYNVASYSRNEAYGFILAAILTKEELYNKCLIIKSQEAWDSMIESQNSLIFIPYNFIPDSIGSAISNGHSVIIAGDYEPKDISININRQGRLVREQGLKKLGFSDDEAYTLYQDTRGYFEPILRHRLMGLIDNLTPKWIEKYHNDILLTILFASRWNEKNGNDCGAIEKLSGFSYSDFQKQILNLSRETDPPIRLIGNIWQVISKVDLWFHVAKFLNRKILEKLGGVAFEILSDYDPSYDLQEDEKYMASVLNVTPKYSGYLKIEISNTLSLLSVLGDNFNESTGREKPSYLIKYYIQKIFQENQNIRFWYSLGKCTRYLAEAAPDEFLSAVEYASRKENLILLELFKLGSDGMFGGCYHSDLLWSLELTSWNRSLLSRVSLCLARLSEIDPGGRFSNRPFHSLVDIYLGWINNTSATHNERIEIISKVLIRFFPEISWRLMVSLLPDNTTMSSGIHKPEYRDWSSIETEKPRTRQYITYIKKIADQLILLVDQYHIGYCDIIKNLGSFTIEQSDKVIEKLLSLDIATLQVETRAELINSLRETIANHREFPDADWVWSDSLLEKLEVVLNFIDFDDEIEKNLYLFNSHWPKLINPIKRKELTYEEIDDLIQTRRTIAIETILLRYREDGLIRLVSKCSLPYLVGHTASISTSVDLFKPFAINWICNDDHRGLFASGYFSALAAKSYDESEKIFHAQTDWSGITKAKFLLCLPLNHNTLRLIDSLPTEGIEYFWKNFVCHTFGKLDTDLIYDISTKLLDYKRPLSAINVIAPLFRSKYDGHRIDYELVSKILLSIVAVSSESDGDSFQKVRHDILKAIEFLQNDDRTSEKLICQIEWAYLNMFRFESIKPIFLINNVAKNPDFFCHLIICIFKRSDGIDDPAENLSLEIRRQRASNSRELLDTVTVLPGQNGEEISYEILDEWVKLTRNALQAAGRLSIGDEKIGEYFSKSPIGKDGIWPHESIRLVVEEIKSEDIDRGIVVGRLNSRGITSRHPHAGGEPERILAKKYFDDSKALELIWPRTSAILKSISIDFNSSARREDMDVELRD